MTGRDTALVKVWRARRADGVPGHRAAGAERLRIGAGRGPDMVLDLTVLDLTVLDLTVSDLTVSDLTVSDLTVSDLTRAPAAAGTAPGVALGPGTAPGAGFSAAGAAPEVSARAVTAPDGRCADGDLVDEGLLDEGLVDEHLVAGPHEHSPIWLACADVIVRRSCDGPGVLEAPQDALDGLCARFPGCLVFALLPHGNGHVVLATAFGWRARLVPLGRAPCVARHTASYASAVHAWLVTGRPVDALSAAELTVACEHTRTPAAAVRVMPDDRPKTRARAG